MPKKIENPDIANCRVCNRQLYRKGGNKARQRTCGPCLAEKAKMNKEMSEAFCG